MSAETFLLPDLGEGLTDVEVVRWLVAEGDVVAVDQIVVEVETAKSVVDVPTPFAGRVATLHAAEGETVLTGKPLITVTAAESAPEPAAAPVQPDAADSPEAEAYREEEQAGSGNVLIGYGTQASTGSGRRRRPRPSGQPDPAPATAAPEPAPDPAPAPDPSPAPAGAADEEPGAPRGVPKVVSPLVRRLAREKGVDLHGLAAANGGGVITRAHVELASTAPAADTAPAAAEAAPPAPSATPVDGERRIPLNGFRRAVSAALSRSRAEIPEATVWVDVDATPLVELRESARTVSDPGPGLLAYLARFVVAGLRQYPVLNSRLDTERQEIVEHDRVNLGLAVQSDRGLVVPAVLGAETMTTEQLDREIRALTARAREGRASAEELSAGTFTLNNYGGFRVDGSAAIINHPQVAILGFGRILDRPWVVDGEIVVRKITQMSFVFDHRVCDGGTASGFIRAVADAIEDPASAIPRL
ncbi:dihydrolipoamide acetyltransferase family protein [Modestobacter sp. VKM Ac-2978]|uniref:dihydrolipoamide acetyltransferase family protein n=1 Tax=Modestobacter sp. VKM Ac-2978 TaxID=3004132 RepID=UPI0022AAF646|nr:dihydrolipoamide acetyltransferase family protein [Modestobacter sp. VKM Ac-2978]MCZ2848722.1 dihydrolipoamide acetyltransferase family protein [Modestobacter sp. VKM Ac-2978]